DPVDSQIVYLLAEDGLYKTKDGGDKWELRTKGVKPLFDGAVPFASQITVDPFNTQMVYLSGTQTWPVLVSADAANDRGIPWASDNSMLGLVAADPSTPNGIFGALVRTAQSDPLIVRMDHSPSATYKVDFSNADRPVAFQIFGDAARTAAVALTLANGTDG